MFEIKKEYEDKFQNLNSELTEYFYLIYQNLTNFFLKKNRYKNFKNEFE